MPQPAPVSVPVRVLIVEDDDPLSAALAGVINGYPGLIVQSRVRTLAAALAALDRGPGLVVVDWMLRDGTALELLRAVQAIHPRPQVLIYSANLAEAAVREALAAGATGYLERSASLMELTTALAAVAAGRQHLGAQVRDVLVSAAAAVTPALPDLTVREREILRLVGEGWASKEIAAQCTLSVRTVENHRASIMRKTGLRSAAQLAVHAVRTGLVPIAVR